MNKTLFFLRQSIRGDTASIVKSLLILRIAVISVFSITVLVSRLDSGKAIIDYYCLFCILFVVFAWTAFCLVAAYRERLPKFWPPSIKYEVLIDFIWVLLVVYFSGKSANPFIYYYLVLIAIASTLLSVRFAWGFCLSAIAIYSVLLYIDSAEHFYHIDSSYRLHLLGMWINFIGASMVTCLFISSLAAALRKQQEELSRIRETQLKNEQLIGLGTLSASTVHALATPLSTLNLLIGELKNEGGVSVESKNDLDLMQQQIARCNDTMKKLARFSDSSTNTNSESVAQFAEDLQEYYLLHSPERQPEFLLDNASLEKMVASDQLFRHALLNLINNALESSIDPVTVNITTPPGGFEVEIVNSLPSGQQHMLESWGKTSDSSKLTGLGIGSFLANSTIERAGGTVKLMTEDARNNTVRVRVTVKMPEHFYA